jgi:hypothetical protein
MSMFDGVIGRPMSATKSGLVVLPLQKTFGLRRCKGYLSREKDVRHEINEPHSEYLCRGRSA